MKERERGRAKVRKWEEGDERAKEKEEEEAQEEERVGDDYALYANSSIGLNF